MTLRGLAEHYGERVRAHPVQELLAGAGIAIGVALVFAVLAANGSIATNARSLVHGIAGSARLELVARGDDGFPAAFVPRVRALRDVAAASPLLEQRVGIEGPLGRRAVALVGLDASVAELNGAVTRELDPALLQLLPRGLILPSTLARALGVEPHGGARRSVLLELRGRLRRLPVSAVLGAAVIGPAADAAVAIAPLRRVQALAGLPGRVTRVLVTPRRGRDAAVRRALVRIAAGRVTVAPVDREVELIARAAAPSYQATGLFAAIAAVCGALLAFNAMLLTAPERRRSIAVLRVAAGYGTRDVATMLLFEAAMLGLLAAGAGLVLGALLAQTLFAGAPSFLSFAFALGGQVAMPASTALLVGAGGVLVTCLAATPLLLDLRRGRPLDAVEREQGEAGQSISAKARHAMGVVALALLGATLLVAWSAPAATIPAIGALAIATALAVPSLGAAVTIVSQWIADRTSWHGLGLACDGVRARTVRAATLAAMAAVAVCGCLAIEGAHRDVLRGLDRTFAQYLAGADVWVTSGDDENSLATEPFPAARVALHIRRLAGVERVDPYYGGFVDVGDRRVWIVAPDAQDAVPIPPSQLLAGRLATASARVRSGGWIAISSMLAASQGAQVGERFALPTPAGVRRYRVAAITTNLGWGPGAVIMSADRYRRDWRDASATALEVRVRQGASITATRAAIEASFGTGSALRAQTTPERAAQFQALARDGLDRLSHIALMLVIAAALSLAAGTIAAIWQRRVSLAVLRISGHLPHELWRVLLLEATIVLATGCAAGAVAGVLGHRLLARWLALTSGYPAPFALGVPQAVAVVGAILAVALALVAVASARAATVDRKVALQRSR